MSEPGSDRLPSGAPATVIDRTADTGGGVGVAAIVMAWIGLVLLLDAVPGRFGPEPVRQVLLGISTWTVLGLLLRRETPLVRFQTLIVVALATAVEYTFSPLLRAYVYRIGTVPAFVPPGHGLVYLAALCLGRSGRRTADRGGRWRAVPALAVGVTVVVGGTWAVHGLTSPRHDVLGAFWFGCLVAFLILGRSRLLYVGAFVVVSYLELVGTRLGTWAWAARDPVLGIIGQGNPPSGAAGGYGWFDLYAMLLAPRLTAAVAALRSRRPRRSRREQLQHVLVELAVGRDRAAPERPVDAVE